MKKIIAFCIIAALAISITACSSSSSEETETSGTTANNPSTQATTEATTPSTSKPFFSPITLAETEDVTVKIMSIEEDGMMGYTLKVFLENKTNLELMFTVENVSVNGFMIDPFWADTVDAGKKANESITFLKSDFEENGIEVVEEITLTLRIYDNNDWLADNIFKESITIKP